MEFHKVWEVSRIAAGLSLLLSVLALVAVSVSAAERGSLSGKVENEKGKGINSATVVAEREGAEPVNVRTNSKGEFTLELEPGEYSLSVEAEGHKNIQLLRKYRVDAGKTTKLNSKITLPISETSSLVRGAVFNERGFSIPGASVEIERLGVTEKESRVKKQYTTNSAGEFAFRLPDNGGQYRVTASARGFEAATQTVELQPGESRSVAFSLKAK
jgi:uncharacterized membrane protein